MAGERERTDRGARGKWEASGKGRLGTEMGAHVGRETWACAKLVPTQQSRRAQKTAEEYSVRCFENRRRAPVPVNQWTTVGPWEKRTDGKVGQVLPAAKGAKDGVNKE